MSTLKTQLLCLILALAAPGAVHGVCVSGWPDKAETLDIRIDSCQSPAAFAAEAADCVNAKWLLRMQEDAVKRADGWVIRGTAVQSQELTIYEDGTALVDPPMRADVPGVWFLPTPSNDPNPFSCPSAPGEERRFIVQSTCCDVLPPGDFSCWFELENLRQVPETLKTKPGYR